MDRCAARSSPRVLVVHFNVSLLLLNHRLCVQQWLVILGRCGPSKVGVGGVSESVLVATRGKGSSAWIRC